MTKEKCLRCSCNPHCKGDCKNCENCDICDCPKCLDNEKKDGYFDT